MSVIVKNAKGAWEWRISCAPQTLTDILVEVAKIDRHGKWTIVCSFHLGELMRQEVEDHASLLGPLSIDDHAAGVLTRWADQLVLYAGIMRSALRTPTMEQIFPEAAVMFPEDDDGTGKAGIAEPSAPP